jgi:hypothetical protein
MKISQHLLRPLETKQIFSNRTSCHQAALGDFTVAELTVKF